jgi:hypothetical protein
MTIRSTARGGALLLAGAVAAFAVASHAQPSERPPTTIAIRALDPTYGGEDYGGGGGGYVTERRDLEVGADGVVRLVGVAAGLDPATVEFRSLTGGDAVRVVEQRVTGNPLEPSALLAASVGKPVAITTAAGELAGTLRAVSDDALVVEGSDRALRIVPRGPQLLAVKLPAGNGDHAPALEWRPDRGPPRAPRGRGQLPRRAGLVASPPTPRSWPTTARSSCRRGPRSSIALGPTSSTPAWP